MSVFHQDQRDEKWQRKARKNVFRDLKPTWDIFPAGGKNRNHRNEGVGVSSMYILEFPEFMTAKDLFDLFRCIGNVVEVLISPRRNKIGRRLGFARFQVAGDIMMLVVRLDNIQISGKKIHVNVPRFNRKVEVGSDKIWKR